MKIARWILGGTVALEGYLAYQRWNRRAGLYQMALELAQRERRPLIVVGSPSAGAVTKLFPAYGCGDACIDLRGCEGCPVSISTDITNTVSSVPTDSAVVFASCVLEYVDNPYKAWAELVRMAGSPRRVFLVTVDSWSTTGILYPQAKWVIHHSGDAICADPITTLRKGVRATELGLLVYASL